MTKLEVYSLILGILFCCGTWRMVTKGAQSPTILAICLYSINSLIEFSVFIILIYLAFKFGFIYILALALFPLSWCIYPLVFGGFENLDKHGGIALLWAIICEFVGIFIFIFLLYKLFTTY